MISLIIIIIAQAFLIVYLVGIARGKKVAYGQAAWFRLLMVVAVISLILKIVGGVQGLAI